tara:strand:+ start:2587 stop:3027 length:441 start_codon:yes stop_codon:yes gene_type:complete
MLNKKMFSLFKKKTKTSKEIDIYSKTASLLIHAAKIDEKYTDKEKIIIEKTLLEIGLDKEKLAQTMSKSEENEKNSSQILDYTKDIKNMNNDFKIKLIESLWKIIYSDKNSDLYESNLMRRLTGLLYLDKKIVGDIKEKVKKDFKN